MLLLAKQTGDYRSVGWGGQIINHNYLQLIHFQAVQNKQPGPLEELTVSLQVACGSVGNELKPRGNKRRGRREVLHDWWRLLLLLFHLIGGVMTWKVAVLWCCWLHAGSAGAFVLFITPPPPPVLPFMYPDGVHFDLLCVSTPPPHFHVPFILCLQALSFPLSLHSREHSRRVYSYDCAHFRSFTLVCRRFICTNINIFPECQCKRSSMWWIFSDVFNSCWGLVPPGKQDDSQVNKESFFLKKYLMLHYFLIKWENV